MRKLAIVGLILLSLDAVSQNNLNSTSPGAVRAEIFTGSVNGQIRTTDGQPAAAVTINITENGKFTVTDEQGRFSISNLKDGIYTLEISMVGLKTQSKTIEIKNGQATTIEIALSENAGQLAEVVIAASQRKLSAGKINIADRD